MTPLAVAAALGGALFAVDALALGASVLLRMFRGIS